MALAGCSDDEPTESIVVESSSAMTLVTNMSTDTHVLNQGTSYKITFDDRRMKATVDILNLQYDGGARVSYRFSNVSFTKNASSERIIDAGKITPDNASAPVFKDMRITVSEIPSLDLEKPDDNTLAVQSASYSIDDKYKVLMIPSSLSFSGQTTTVNSTNQQSFVSDKSTYVVALDFTRMKAVLSIYNAAFDANMPSLGVMVFGSDDEKYGSIDMALTADGFKLSCDRLTPSIGGTPYPRFAVSNLNMNVVPGGKSQLKFDCMVYNVTAELSNGH